MQAQITNPFTIGKKIEYTKDNGVYGYETIIATIVVVNGNRILLDNGDELNRVQLELGKGY